MSFMARAQSGPSLFSNSTFRICFVAVLLALLYHGIRDAVRVRCVTHAGSSACLSRSFLQGPMRFPTVAEKVRDSMAVDMHPCWLRLSSSNVTITSGEARCCLRALRDSLPLALTRLRDGPWLRKHGFSEHFITSLPFEDVPRFNRCAVVSNSPAMRLHLAGREIDAMDAVFRLNVAPRTGYEEYVGSKETIRVANTKDDALNSPHVKEAGRHRKVFFRAENGLMSNLNTPVDAQQQNLSTSWNRLRPKRGRNLDVMGTLRNMSVESESGTVYVSHPAFSDFSLFELESALVERSSREASTGTVALILALMSCEHVISYELMSNTDLSKKYRYYYQEHNASGGYDFFHPRSIESRLQQVLATSRRGTTNIYEFDMASAEKPGHCDESGS